jgi:hypothetical protein
MQDQINKPIFVVGSPRSGTSILTWSLGHHPNLFPVPESNWMGDFALSVAISYRIGVARGDRSILSAMEIQDDELFAAFGRSVNDLILRHRTDLERKRETRSITLKLDARWLEATSTAAGPKRRWVDGTPEYSLHISGLRKLFPDARFVHIVRDVGAVVRSMLNFQRIAETPLVPTEEKAYQYWLRTVKACVEAERAYGPSVVHRIRYADLIDNPESAMRSLLDFLEEPYTAKCLEPLRDKINSSDVPADFRSDDPATDPTLVKEAQRLSREIENTAQPSESSPSAARKMAAAFAKRVQYVATLQVEKSRLESAIRAYQGENLRLESAVAGLQRQIEDLRCRLAQGEKYILELTDRLHKQLSNTRKLSHLFDNVEAAAERLSSSRRWRLANPGKAMRAKLSSGKVPTGYDHLDKIVAAYSRWRALHPEIAKMDDPMESTRLFLLSDSERRVEDSAEMQSKATDRPSPADEMASERD